jgi:flagellar biosynthesis protein FlhF
MLVKTYRAKTTTEALATVRAELGDAACIVETRRVAKGVEVVAAAERPGPRLTAAPRLGSLTLEAVDGAERLRDELIVQGFSVVFAERIAAAAAANLDPERLDDRAAALGYARDLVALWLPKPSPLPEKGARVIAVVGSPGVGKTTTVAKLAAREVALEGRPVVLGSADDRRLGGAEQIEAYARVLGAPFRMLRDRRDLDRARELAGAKGTLLIDTPGVARGDRMGMDSLALLLGGVRREEIELLLAADRDADGLHDTVKRFGALRPGAIGATRLDETLRPGSLLTALTRAGLPVRHLCGGPNVPDDLEVADPRRLAAWALPRPGEAVPAPGAPQFVAGGVR